MNIEEEIKELKQRVDKLSSGLTMVDKSVKFLQGYLDGLYSTANELFSKINSICGTNNNLIIL